ncbi:MAG: hypothetical protein ACE5JS_04970, partial [Nitrospinota bacterium]
EDRPENDLSRVSAPGRNEYAGQGPVNPAPPIPCYVSGKGMHASDRTRNFKVIVIEALEASGLGYDTRYRFYRKQFPGTGPGKLARMVCDPIELYDKDWKDYLAKYGEGRDEEGALAEFVLERDSLFRREAKAAVYCYDEAGFGSGVNSMRFIGERKPILGFYHPESKKSGTNLTNIIQLRVEYPERVTLVAYRSLDEIPGEVNAWLRGIANP